VYQLVGGYEDANDSNVLRHGPIYKIACERLRVASEELLASQPTITRLENHVTKREVSAMRSRMVEGFINRYERAPIEIVLDIDGWDDHDTRPTTIELFSRLFWSTHVFSSVNQ
jgi:hypothetical protein